MSPVAKQILGAVIVVGLLGVWAYNSWVLQPERQQRRYSEHKAEVSKRFNDWAYVAKVKEIAPGETIKLVIVPHTSGIEFMDTKCLIYTHHEFRTSSMVCPDATQNNIDE